jgi:hypothetical protein
MSKNAAWLPVWGLVGHRSHFAVDSGAYTVDLQVPGEEAGVCVLKMDNRNACYFMNDATHGQSSSSQPNVVFCVDDILCFADALEFGAVYCKLLRDVRAGEEALISYGNAFWQAGHEAAL